MRYIPATNSDRRKMLAAIGVESIEHLSGQVPDKVRLKRELSLPPALSEQELLDQTKQLSVLNANTDEYTYFLGGGAYNHIIPSVVKHLASRGEFYTCYTPYQPELSQGTLQAIYEFQTLICLLTDMEVANASMYEGASATAEAALMSLRINNRREILVSKTVHPEYREVLRTYLAQNNVAIIEADYCPEGTTDPEAIMRSLSGDTSAVIIQTPNFFGCIEDIRTFAEIAHKTDALLIVTVAEPMSLGILTPPGNTGADVVAGEGQSLGNPLYFGGPYLGFFATRGKYLRSMPGRLVGKTLDQKGRPGYVLTLATREQHIRRGKATSNICTNEALCALNATIYMCTMGRVGLRDLAILNLRKASFAKETLSQIEGCNLPFSAPIFNEFVLQLPASVSKANGRLLEERIIGGLDISKYYPELGNSMLVCVTEKNTREDIEKLARLLKSL